MAEEWLGGAQAYKSINAHGYPNLFIMTGPNSGPGHNSLLVYVEGQLDYAVSGNHHDPAGRTCAISTCAKDVNAPLQRSGYSNG